MSEPIRWDNVIESYLKYYNDYYDFSYIGEDAKPYHLLFVEGFGDCLFYNDFFKKLLQKKRLDYTILKKNILFDFTNKFNDDHKGGKMHIDDYGQMIFNDEVYDDEIFIGRDTARQEKLQEKLNEEVISKVANAIYNPTKPAKTGSSEVEVVDYENKYYNFKFPIKCLDVYNKIKLNHIDIFGIIDQDFGHNEIYSDGKLIKNLSVSKFHDRETTFMRYSLQNYVKKADSHIKPELINKIVDVLKYSTKQGILEKSSFILNQLKNDPSYCINESLFSECYNKITAYTKSKLESDYPNNLRFYDYLFFTDDKLRFSGHSQLNIKSLKSYFIYKFHINDSSDPDAITAKGIYTSVINEINRIFTDFCSLIGCSNDETSFDASLDNIIRNWLNSSDYDLDNIAINRIFEYSNGHIILRHLLLDNGNSKLFYKNKSSRDVDLLNTHDDDFEADLLNLFIDELNISDIDVILNNSPLKEYISYRNNGEKNSSFIVEKQKSSHSMVR